MARRRKPVTLFDVIHRGNPVAYTPKSSTPSERQRPQRDESADTPVVSRGGLRTRVALWLLGNPSAGEKSRHEPGVEARANPTNANRPADAYRTSNAGPALNDRAAHAVDTAESDSTRAADPTAGADPIGRAMRIMEARRSGRSETSASDLQSDQLANSSSDVLLARANDADAIDTTSTQTSTPTSTSAIPPTERPDRHEGTADCSAVSLARSSEDARSGLMAGSATRRPALSAMERLRNELRANGSSTSAVYFESSRDVDLDSDDRSSDRPSANQSRSVNGSAKTESRASKKKLLQRDAGHAVNEDRRASRDSSGPGWLETAIAGLRYRWAMRMRAIGHSIRSVAGWVGRLLSTLAPRSRHAAIDRQAANAEHALDRPSGDFASDSTHRSDVKVASIPTMRWAVLAIPLAGLFVFSFGLGRVMLRAGSESGSTRPDVLDIAGPIDAGAELRTSAGSVASDRSRVRSNESSAPVGGHTGGSASGVANVASAPVQAEVQRNPGVVPARAGGVNYVIVQSYPDEMTAQSVADLLTSRGIPATVEKNLPRWSRPGATLYSVVGLDAFERMSNNPQYARYVDRIRKLSDDEFNKGLNKRLDPHAYRWPQ